MWLVTQETNLHDWKVENNKRIVERLAQTEVSHLPRPHNNEATKSSNLQTPEAFRGTKVESTAVRGC